jgi:hypothetical protein
MNNGGSKPPIPRGSRLTFERLAAMNVGSEFLLEAEKQLLINVLFKCESAIAFDDSEMGVLRSEIEPPVIIHTIPSYPLAAAKYSSLCDERSGDKDR